MHGSYEDRPGAQDPVLACLDDEAYERQVEAWARELERAGAADADLLYLHHLTPLNEAAARAFPELPVLGHVHGTELLMLERIAAGAPAGWAHAEEWRAPALRMGGGLRADRGQQRGRPGAGGDGPGPRARALRRRPQRLRPDLRPRPDRPRGALAPHPGRAPAGLAPGRAGRQRRLRRRPTWRRSTGPS